MGVNILEGKKVDRIATALEVIANGQNVTEDIRDLILADRNKLTNQTWSLTEAVGNTPSYHQINFTIDGSREHVFWAPVNADLAELHPRVQVRIENEAGRQWFMQQYNHLYQDLEPVTITASDNYYRVFITIQSPSYNIPDSVLNTIFFGEVTASTNLTSLEKQYVRKKLHSVSFEDIPSIKDGLLDYKNFQTLTDTEKVIAQANIGLTNTVARTLVDRNILASVQFFDEINDDPNGHVARTEALNIIAIDPTKKYAISLKGCTSSDSILVCKFYNEEGGFIYTETYPGNVVSLVKPRNQTCVGIKIGIDDPSDSHYADNPENLFFGELTGSETTALTDVEKAHALKKIGGLSADEVNDAITGAVKYTVQELAPEQKQVARQNIGAISSEEVNNAVTGVVKYTAPGPDTDVETGLLVGELTVEQKQQARTNIGAISSEEVNQAVTGVVKYTDQNLDPEQKQKARQNIGAISSEEVNNAVTGVVKYTAPGPDTNPDTGLLDGELTSEQKQQARTNIGAISSEEVNNAVTGVVKYTAPGPNTNPDTGLLVGELTEDEKAQARLNIGALSSNDTAISELITNFNNVSRTVTELSDDVADVSLSDDKTKIIVTYAKNGPDGLPVTAELELKVDTGVQISDVVYTNNQLFFYDENRNPLFNSPFTITGGGGGTGGEKGGYAYIDPITATRIDSIYKQETVRINFEYTSKYFRTEAPTDGIATWTINSLVVANDIVVTNGTNNYFDVTEYLTPGNNTITVSVSADLGTGSEYITTCTWRVNAVNLYIDWPFNDSAIHESAFNDSYTVYGGSSSVNIEIHTVLYITNDDGSSSVQVLESQYSNRQVASQTITIPVLPHGTHGIERWATTTVNGSAKSTERQYHEIIFAEVGATDPIISIQGREFEVNHYDTVSIPYMVYDPRSITTSVELLVDGVSKGMTDPHSRTITTWEYNPSSSTDIAVDSEGHQINTEHVLTIKYKSVERSVVVTVKPIQLNVSEVQGYTYKFKASDFATNEAVKNWSADDVTIEFNTDEYGRVTKDFDWVNGGLKTETVNEDLEESVTAGATTQQYFCIKAGDRMRIKHQMFATDPTSNGMSFKMVFKVKNCREYDATIATCATNSGIVFNAHRASLFTPGVEVTTQYGEDEYIEVEFDVYPKVNGSNRDYFMAWVDGVMTSCRIYSTGFTHGQSPQDLVLGSDYCDLYIYLIKFYPRVNPNSNIDDHLSNFILDAPNSSEMMRRFNRNDILSPDTNEIGYAELAEKNKDLRVWLYDMPYMTNGKKDKVGSNYTNEDLSEVPTFRQIYKKGTGTDSYPKEYQLTGKGFVSVQGTSSVNYIRGAANTDIDFIRLVDGNNRNLLANGVKDKSYGGSNNWYEKDETTGKAKVYNAADVPTVTPEYVVVERDENQNPTKYIKALGYKVNDDSCPITYANLKVNFASCEQVNNMCNAKWYQSHNPYPSFTKRDCMEYEMGVQFIRDQGLGDNKHFRVFNDNNYHMYSIGNLGNSKKNVHIFHDMSNEAEMCVEVKDNTQPQMWMTSAEGMNLDGTTYPVTNAQGETVQEDWSGDVFYEMRYPDAEPTLEMRKAWYRLVHWFADNNPNAATGERLDVPEQYEDYVFQGHNSCAKSDQVLYGTKITQFNGPYTHDTFDRRVAKMLRECEDYMDMDSFVFHFLYLERHTMVDNVSKNNFWSSRDYTHWNLCKAYDMDTSDGNDNQGKLVYDYGLEYNSKKPNSTINVFNGGQSVWFIFVGALKEAIRRMYQRCEELTPDVWSASAYYRFLRNEQKKVPERCWNQCYYYDYLRTHEDQSIDASTDGGAWISFLDGGQKTHQRKHYETYQELFIAGKYRGSTSTTNRITIFAYSPSEWGGVVTASAGATLRTRATTGSASLGTIAFNEPVTITSITTNSTGVKWYALNYNSQVGYVLASDVGTIEPAVKLTLRPYNDVYVSVDYGTTTGNPVKLIKGQETTIDLSGGSEISNAMVYINNASMVQSIGGIEAMYPREMVLGAARRLTSITIGTSEYNYQNTNLDSTLSFGNNQMLERIVASNLPNATMDLDLSNCPNLVYFDGRGSGFSAIIFADGGVLETALLECPTVLILNNLNRLSDYNISTSTGLLINNTAQLEGLKVTGTNNLNVYTLISNLANLRYITVLGLNWRMADTAILDRLYRLEGYNDNLTINAHSILSGYVWSSVLRRRMYDNYVNMWPELEIETADDKVTWVEESPIYFYDSNTLDKKAICVRGTTEPYVQYVLDDDYIYDPITTGDVDIPVKPDDEQYSYTFSDWSINMIGNISEAQRWVSGASYVIGDLVRNGNNVYECKQPTQDMVFDSSKWYRILARAVDYNGEIYAVFNTETRKYTVRWYADDAKTTLLAGPIEVEYGSEAVYSEDPFNIPVNTRGNRLFNGWKQSSGYITEDLDIIADWMDALTPPQGKQLKNMTPAEIYAVTKTNNIEYDESTGTGYWTPKDYVDIILGQDYEFENLQFADGSHSRTLLENAYFDGTISSNLRINDCDLLSKNAGSFTMAIDYEFNPPSTDTLMQTLVSISSANSGMLFRLEYTPNNSNRSSENNQVSVVFGDQQYVIGRGIARGMVVVSHEKGSKKINIYSSNYGIYTNSDGSIPVRYTNSERNTTSSYVQNTEYVYSTYGSDVCSYSDALIDIDLPEEETFVSFGGGSNINGFASRPACGWIYSCKIWPCVLGNHVCTELANWPHETLRMHYRGKNTYQLADKTNSADHANFISNSALPMNYPFYRSVASVTNQIRVSNNINGGWENSDLRSFVNNRVFRALPYAWRALIKPVNLFTRGTSLTPQAVRNTVDRIFIPSLADIMSTNDGYIQAEGSLTPWFNSTENRVLAKGLIIPEDGTIYTTVNDPSSGSTLKTGDIWIPANNNVAGIYQNDAFVYISADYAQQHGYVSGYYINGTIGDNHILIASIGNGSLWVRATGRITRTPYVANTDSITNAYQYFIHGVTREGYSYPYTGGSGHMTGYTNIDMRQYGSSHSNGGDTIAQAITIMFAI